MQKQDCRSNDTIGLPQNLRGFRIVNTIYLYQLSTKLGNVINIAVIYTSKMTLTMRNSDNIFHFPDDLDNLCLDPDDLAAQNALSEKEGHGEARSHLAKHWTFHNTGKQVFRKFTKSAKTNH
jgi:hypothetical protein